MNGILTCVGVGPGDPELMTLKARRVLLETPVIAFPGKSPEESVAYSIAVRAVPEIAAKTLLPLFMPMTRDPASLAMQDAAAERLADVLRSGQNAAFLTLGDPGIYSTFTPLAKRLAEAGFAVRTVPGVPSFCAAAAALCVPLTETAEALHILPAADAREISRLKGTCVIMKSGKAMPEVLSALSASGREAAAAENCGMPGERLFRGAEEIPADAGYFTVILARESINS